MFDFKATFSKEVYHVVIQDSDHQHDQSNDLRDQYSIKVY